MNSKSFDIDKKLSNLLRDNVIAKYTKNDKKTYQELLNYTINIEIYNNELERKVECHKKEFFKANQTNIDLNLELEECKMKIHSLSNIIKMKENTIKFTNSQLNTEERKNLENSYSRKSIHDSDRMELSLSDTSLDDLSINNDVLGTMKKKKKNEKKIETKNMKLENENKTLLNDLNLLIKEVKLLRSSIEEKDNIISILYQEVENLKNSRQEEEEEDNSNQNKEEERVNESFSYKEEIQKNMYSQHIENLDSIKQSLVEFLKYYGIKENFSKCSSNSEVKDNNDYIIDMRMKEIKYILINLKKINIIFKTLFMEYSKNLVTVFQNEHCSILNSKLEKMENKLNRFSIITNKLYNNKKLLS